MNLASSHSFQRAMAAINETPPTNGDGTEAPPSSQLFRL